MKKKLKIFLTVTAVILISCAAFCAVLWWMSCRQPVKLEDLKAELSYVDRITPGGDLHAVLSFRLPLCRKPENITVNAAPGTVAAGVPQVVWSRLRPSGRSWQIKVLLRPLRIGKISAGSIQFDTASRGEKPQISTAEIPSFEVDQGAAAEKLETAPEIKLSSTGISRWYWLLLLLIPAGVLLVYLLRRPKKPRELTEWERAVKELSLLRQKIQSGSLPPERAFIDLTELMRRYLERRFDLPVTRSTAQEFVRLLDMHGDSFPKDSKPFLREFIEQADMVKFARSIPELSLVERSASSAESFIGHTRPESEVKDV